MEQLAGVLTDDEEFLELVEMLEPHRAVKVFRMRENHFVKWNDTDFIKRFRLSKDAVRFLLNHIRNQISHPTDRNNEVSPEDMLFVTLRFYATGSFLQVAGDLVGIDKSTASRIVYKVTRAIAGLNKQFIKMPETDNEMRFNSQQFYNISRFPKCIGAIDCTHIKISSPGGNEAEIFRNRKSFFSFNVQAICDASCKFQNIVCRWPGSSHDSHIFNNSRIKRKFENGNFERYVIVGDSGYGIKPYLITPLGNPQTRAENLFNECQVRTRNPIERCFGIWKRRFPVLAFGIRLKINKVESIVISTAVLHNIALLFNDPLPAINEEEEDAIQFVNNVDVVNLRDNPGRNVNNLVRYRLINEYFNRL